MAEPVSIVRKLIESLDNYVPFTPDTNGLFAAE